MEARRQEETDEESLNAVRRGWCLGSKEFKKQMLERMEGHLREDHDGALRLETAQAKAERIIEEELDRLGWKESDLACRRKNDPAKLALAARLRRETTLTLKSIAARAGLGSSKSANVKLHVWMRANPPSAIPRAGRGSGAGRSGKKGAPKARLKHAARQKTNQALG